MQARNKLVFVFSTLLIGLGFVLPAAADINFSSTVPNDQKNLIQQDLINLNSLTFTDTEQEGSQLFKTAMTAANLKAWLMERSHYIVSEDFQVDSSIRTLNPTYSFSNPVMPDIERPPKGYEAPKPNPNLVVKVAMSNVGTGAYLRGKRANALVGLDIPGQGVVPINSPRVGIFKVGAGLFMSLDGSDNYKTFSASIRRLMVFFHEARHSDGNAKSLGFLHAVCPEGHNLAGRNACDRNLNGPYTIGGVFMKSAVESCSRCRSSEKEALRGIYADSFGRVLMDFKNPNQPADTAASTDDLKKTCENLAQLKVDISSYDACKNLGESSAEPAAPPEKLGVLDETPEKGVEQ